MVVLVDRIQFICENIFPLILYSMLLNQVEITYIFLNNLFKNRVIKKLNSTQNNTIFDYYHNNQEIEMNFIPIILKFIQDNYKNNFNEDFYSNKKIVLESDSNTIELILFIIGLVLFIYQTDINKDFNKSEITNTNKNNLTKNKLLNLAKNKILNNNGYIEITVDSNINNIIDTDSVQNQNQNQYKIKEKDRKINKNIWISSTNTISNTNKINDNQSYSEKSSISESEIFFN